MKLHHVLALAACVSSAAASTVRQLEGSTAGSSANANTGTTAGGTSTTNGDLKVISYPNDKYHMPAVRVVHARVQSDAPIAVEGTLVSSFGDGDRDAGYLSALDTVNTASVEGALMYVQAEGINVNSRAAEERCERKNGMAYIVFYEVLVSQTNETIAQFQDDWETPEYGPMIPMDSGRCTPLKGSDSSNVPVECLQFNGVDGQPNLGPFVGGGTKSDDVRAPYPDTYWFSFPNTCPTEAWGDKTDECRASTRQGLCDFGYAPNGVDCTFAYTILGWVPIDDVVGITKIENNATGELFANFTEWCEASEDNVEFSADSATGEFESGLPFWEDPLNSEANAKRATAVLEAYAALLENGSSQVDPEVLADFQKLPTVEELAAVNPPCYETVATCGDAPGCKRVGYSQICTKCEEGENCPVNDGSFTFPDLAKAPTDLSDNETTTDKGLLDSAGTSKGGSSSGSGSAGSSGSGSNGAVSVTLSVAVAALGAALGVAIGM